MQVKALLLLILDLLTLNFKADDVEFDALAQANALPKGSDHSAEQIAGLAIAIEKDIRLK